MKKLFMRILAFLLVAGFAFAGYFIHQENTPAHLFDIEDPQQTYTVVVNSGSDTYGIYPLRDTTSMVDKDHPAYINASPVNLDQFVNKKVKITGSFTWQNGWLKAPHNTREVFRTNAEAVTITSIRLAL